MDELHKKLVELCNKYTQEVISKKLWYSRITVNAVYNWKIRMGRAMRYALNEINESTIEYDLVLDKVIEYVSKEKDRIYDITYKLPLDVQKRLWF